MYLCDKIGVVIVDFLNILMSKKRDYENLPVDLLLVLMKSMISRLLSKIPNNYQLVIIIKRVIHNKIDGVDILNILKMYFSDVLIVITNNLVEEKLHYANNCRRCKSFNNLCRDHHSILSTDDQIILYLYYLLAESYDTYVLSRDNYKDYNNLMRIIKNQKSNWYFIIENMVISKSKNIKWWPLDNSDNIYNDIKKIL